LREESSFIAVPLPLGVNQADIRKNNNSREARKEKYRQIEE
jgi:hypothetical protein